VSLVLNFHANKSATGSPAAMCAAVHYPGSSAAAADAARARRFLAGAGILPHRLSAMGMVSKARKSASFSNNVILAP